MRYFDPPDKATGLVGVKRYVFNDPNDKGNQESSDDRVFIGTLRRELFMDYDCKWNGYVRDVTAELELNEKCSRAAVYERIFKDTAKLMTANEFASNLREPVASPVTLSGETELQRAQRISKLTDAEIVLKWGELNADDGDIRVMAMLHELLLHRHAAVILSQGQDTQEKKS